MTKWYHAKKALFTIMIISLFITVYSQFDLSGIAFVIVPVCILAFFMNVASWIDDTKKWNKGVCNICNAPWVASEGNVYEEVTYHCQCGRTLWF